MNKIKQKHMHDQSTKIKGKRSERSNAAYEYETKRKIESRQKC